MHMTSGAKYTARALDIMLTENEKRKDDDPLKFYVGRLGDYLVPGYDQNMKEAHNEINSAIISRTDTNN